MNTPTTELKPLYEIGESPPLGKVPERMYAWMIRRERFGEPRKSFQVEVVDVPELDDDDVLVHVMAAGVNYNGVWAGRGTPVDVIPKEDDFLAAGTDGSGIVYRVGKNVRNVQIGDNVVLGGTRWDPDCPRVRAGEDPCFSRTFHIHGYESNWGSFAQFSRVQAHQCFPKPPHLSWEAAACYLASALTSYRMLHRWGEHAVRPDDLVLVWGGAGGLGSLAIQIAREAGARPIAVISADSKKDFCTGLGAIGCINRTHFGHWGPLPHWTDTDGYETWLQGDGEKGGALAFGRALWEAAGEKRNPRIVIEHPGEDTTPTSMFVCDNGGMVVTCAGTTGYSPIIDLRYLWMRQKRFQGSHAGNLADIRGANDLAMARRIDPCLSRTFSWDELSLAHQLMADNEHPPGNMGVLVSAPEPGQGILPAAGDAGVAAARFGRKKT